MSENEPQVDLDWPRWNIIKAKKLIHVEGINGEYVCSVPRKSAQVAVTISVSPEAVKLVTDWLAWSQDEIEPSHQDLCALVARSKSMLEYMQAALRQ